MRAIVLQNGKGLVCKGIQHQSANLFTYHSLVFATKNDGWGGYHLRIFILFSKVMRRYAVTFASENNDVNSFCHGQSKPVAVLRQRQGVPDSFQASFIMYCATVTLVFLRSIFISVFFHLTAYPDFLSAFT